MCLRPRPRSLSAILLGPSRPVFLEDFLPCRQHFVQRFLKVSRAFGKWLAYLRNILFKALFYLLSKELFESTVSETFRVFGRMVGDDVRYQGAGETLGALIRILREERIQRTTRPRVAGGR